MRPEPIELGLAPTSKGRRNVGRRRRAFITSANQSAGTAPLAPDAIDEAFASLPPHLAPNNRVDLPASRNDVRRNGAAPKLAANVALLEKRSLFGNLASQVAALDRQCEQLAHLVQSLESDASAEK
jgi:hypothetical protein